MGSHCPDGDLCQLERFCGTADSWSSLMYAELQSGGESILIRFNVFSFRLRISLRRLGWKSGSSRDIAPDSSRRDSENRVAPLLLTSSPPIDRARPPASTSH